MATTPNQKPVPSEDYANMRFNAGKFDEFMTSPASSYVDRLGVTHLTVKGIQASVTGALLPANNLSDVQSAATSRTNLGATTIGTQVFTATTAAAARAALGVAASAGITDASNASAGVVGEVLSATTTSTSMSNGVAVNLTSLTLTAGDWDVRASFRIVGTNLGQILGGLNTTSATTPSFPNRYNFSFSSFITSTFSDCTPSIRINVNSSTTVYLAMAVGNSSSTATGTGDGYITARRIR